MRGFLRTIFRPAEQRAIAYDENVWGGFVTPTHAGVSVTHESALTYSAVFAAIRILAEGVAMLPLMTYQRMNPGKRRATSHPVYSLLHDAPNPEMTSFEWRETAMGHLASWGNHYSNIEWNNGGRPLALWPLRPDRMRPKRENGELVYYYRLPSLEERRLRAHEVLHLRGMGGNGLVGYSPITLARESIALGLATQEFGSRFFGNDARPGGVLTHPGELGDTAAARLKKSWETRHGGLSRSHRVAILEEGMKYEQIGIPPEDAQFLETRKFQVAEIARWFNVPPHRLADLERATFSNIEQMSLEFVMYTLMPWLTRIEQRLSLQMLSARERSDYFMKFLVAGLLRGDVESRHNAYAQGRQNGYYTANDVREFEDMNPVAGGDVLHVPLNMVPADEIGMRPESEEGRQARRAQRAAPLRGDGVRGRTDESREARGLRSAATRQRLMRTYRRVLADAAGRVIRRETNDILNRARRVLVADGVEAFLTWLRSWYDDDHIDFFKRQMTPVLLAYAELVAREAADEIGGEIPDLETFVRSYTGTAAVRNNARHEATIGRVVREADDPLAALESELESWRDSKPDTMGFEESVRAGNAIAKIVYAAGGIRTLVWVAFGSSCPYCTALNGRTVGIDEMFIPAGEALDVDGAEPLMSNYDVGHAPAHRGCDCTIRAG